MPAKSNRRTKPSTRRKAPAANKRKTARKRRIRAAAKSATYSPVADKEPFTVPATWWAAFRLALGIWLLPVSFVSTLAFFDTFATAAMGEGFWRSQEVWFFGMGLGIWLAAFWTLPRPMIAYVLGHELTHAFFILLCGGKIEKFKIGRDGGYVVTNKNNFLISLSPYFIPFYTVMVILAFGIAGLCIDVTELYPGMIYGIAGFKWLWAVFALVGLTWGFHLTFTVWMISKDQPDLRENGIFFSLVLIFIVNLLVITLGLIAASPEATFDQFVAHWIEDARGLLGWFEGIGKAIVGRA